MRNFFTKKRIIWGVIILVVVGLIGFAIFRPKNNAANILTDTAKFQDLKQTVLSTGQVVSSTDLSLSFQASGVVRVLNVKEGSVVKLGQILATLDQKDVSAALTSARGTAATAQANYDRILAGASSEDVAVAQATVDSATNALATTKTQQAVLVKNAQSAMLNAGLAAIPGSNSGSGTLAVSGTYTGTDQGQYKISLSQAGGGLFYTLIGLESGSGNVIVGSPIAIGTRGLFITFSSTGTFTSNDSWTISIPNTQASTYLSAYNVYQASLQTQAAALSSAQSTLDSATAALNLKKAQARPADVEAAKAQILSAQGQLQSAQSAYENTIIRAPAGGTITSVDIKIGELASATKEVMILQDVGDLHVESNVSEANIASIKTGQSVDYTFDALGPDQHFAGSVQVVNPASTVVSGVVNYKVTASVDNQPDIKPGMTANMTILVATKDHVLSVPSTAIISQNGKQFVRVIDDPKKKTFHQVEVQTGIQADGGVVEILSGISDGTAVVTFIKT